MGKELQAISIFFVAMSQWLSYVLVMAGSGLVDCALHIRVGEASYISFGVLIACIVCWER